MELFCRVGANVSGWICILRTHHAHVEFANRCGRPWAEPVISGCHPATSFNHHDPITFPPAPSPGDRSTLVTLPLVGWFMLHEGPPRAAIGPDSAQRAADVAAPPAGLPHIPGIRPCTGTRRASNDAGRIDNRRVGHRGSTGHQRSHQTIRGSPVACGFPGSRGERTHAGLHVARWDGSPGSGREVRPRCHGHAHMQARIDQPAAGSCFLQRQTAQGMAGPFVGHVRFDGKDTAWKLVPAADLQSAHFIATTSTG